MKKYFVFILLIVLQTGFVNAQQPKYASSNPTAIKFFEDAIKCFDKQYNEKGFQYLDDALKEDPGFVDAYMVKANIYEDQKNYPKAIEAYQKSFLINPDYFPNSYYTLGKIEFGIQHYDSARVHVEKFLTFKGTSPDLVEKANLIFKSCDFAIEALKHPVPFNPVNMGDSINSAEIEHFPAITADGKTLIFTRALFVADNGKRKIYNDDFYISNFVNDHWSKARPLSEINTDGNEGAPSISADGQYLFFASCEDRPGNYAGNRKGFGSCDIFLSKKVGSLYQQPRNLGSVVNTSAWESQPSFSSDGRTLYFIRAVRSKYNKTNTDIFVTHIDDSTGWSVPVPLGETINTIGDEESVFIHPDGKTLYFSSNGHPGMGGLDLFMSKKLEDGSWDEPVNLGYPINTSNDERSLMVSPSGSSAYFGSDRTGGKGDLDLYQFDLYPAVRPEPITYMKGKVFDADTKAPLFASFELIDLATAKTVIRSTSNTGNGEFLVCVPSGKNYALNVSKDGYLFYSENFTLKDPKNAKEPVIKDVPLHPIKAGESVVLKNIFYDTDAYVLKDESKAELGKLVSFLNKYPKTTIEIAGHTDNVGTKPYNQVLSEKRAKAVYDYLIANGIPASRLTFKGYGDSKPIASNEKEEGRSQNRRTEFMIVSMN